MGFKVEIEHIWSSYRLLKTYAYFENLNLFIKSRLAEFENTYIHQFTQFTRNHHFINSSEPFPSDYSFEAFKKAVDGNDSHPFIQLVELLNHDTPRQHPQFIDWLNDVKFRLVPKKVISENASPDGGALFITNKKTAPEYIVDKVNYFIDAPIELHIIDIMWTALAGCTLDNKLTKDCFGNRLSDRAKLYREAFYKSEKLVSQQGELFRRYVEQYNDWRNNAIDTALSLTKSDCDAAIFSLDLKSYYYNIDLDFNKIKETIVDQQWNQQQTNFEKHLSELLEAIHNRYSSLIKPSATITHPDEVNRRGIPIGFASSSMLANWYLTEFDEHIAQIVRPAYYGRYVDDILIVFKDPTVGSEVSDKVVEQFVSVYFSDVLSKVEPDETEDQSDKDPKTVFQLDEKFHSLPIQGDKLILQYFDREHTLAGLEVFQKELEERSSAFRFLPDDHITADFEKYAYDILYDGSANKFRSIVGLAENETELSKYLSSHIIAHRLCQIQPDNNPIPKIEKFFKGVNALRFSRMWEKVFSYALIKGGKENNKFAREFYEGISKLIENSSMEDKEKNGSTLGLTNQLRIDLQEYLRISVFMPMALLGPGKASGTVFDRLDPSRLFAFEEIVRNLRVANMFRHNHVAYPLFNFTEYGDNLSDPHLVNQSQKFTLSKLYLELSPRFIHFEEWQLFDVHSRINQTGKNNPFLDFSKSTVSEYKKYWFDKDFPVSILEPDTESGGNKGIQINQICIGTDKKSPTYPNKIKVAIANMRVDPWDIENAYREDKTPNINFARQKSLFKILNDAEEFEVKLLVLPEVSIPVSWLPFMLAHARRHQIGIIFGLEHWVIKKNGKRFAYNLIVEALPFKVSGKYNSCLMTVRVKNHYAPEEKANLESYRITPAEPESDEYLYNLVEWSGIQFASYNCFELANIEHRSLFRSKLDLLVACVWNKDTNYYDHILESATRDLFCYVIQSNTSQYGGSCVLKPSRSIESRIIKVKGGDNSCILTTELDIDKLRAAQHKSMRNGDKAFKTTPPGYEHDQVLERK